MEKAPKKVVGYFFMVASLQCARSPKAITATVRKLAILVYRSLKGELDYADPGASAYDEQHRERTLRNVRNRAKGLGFGLVDLETGELLQGAVS